jgi:hypothetical protein
MSKRKGPQMTSNKLKTVELQISWNNIQDFIASNLYSLAKGKINSDDEIVKIKLNYAGGYVPEDKIIPVEVITRKGVSKHNIG